MKINLNDFNGSIDAIKECISNNYYEENYDELITAKNIVLEKISMNYCLR